MESIAFGATTYSPTSSRTGFSGKSLLRLKNMVLAGVGADVYLQCYAGSLNLNETIPTLNLTGTLSAVSGSLTIVGVGTQFTTELRSGQWFWAEDDPFMVNQIIDDTHLTVYRGPSTALAASTGERMPVMFEIARQRGTLIQGNAYQLDKGSILGTGTGTLLINGQPLQGESAVFAGGPQIALFDPATGNYDVADVGFDTPTVAPTLSEELGTGTVGMQPGECSIRLVPSSTVTAGYSNPGPRANVTLTTANSRIKVDVNAVPMDTAALQDGWDAYGSQLGVVNVNQGPWQFIRTVPESEIAAGIFYLEYLNAEIARQGELDFDADPPPATAGFLAMLQGNPQWVSCFGKWGGSPGPSLIPAKPQDIEAAPEIWNVTSSPPEDILGVVSSLARLYLLCAQTLQQGVYAPSGDPLIPPTQIRPYWSMGFANPYQLMFALGVLIGYAQGGPTRSIADAETVDAQFLGANVAEIIQDWIGAHVMVQRDPNPLVNAACFFHPANALNDDGFWTTEVLIWGFNQQDWIGHVLLTSETQDMVVSGLATVDNHLYFLAGGRVGADIQFDTLLWNSASGDPVDYYAVWELQAGQILDHNKSVKAFRANGKFTLATAKIYGFDSATPEDLTDIKSGINAQISISLGTTTNVENTSRIRVNVPNQFVFTARVDGTYNGTDEQVDRIGGVVLEYISSGVRR